MDQSSSDTEQSGTEQSEDQSQNQQQQMGQSSSDSEQLGTELIQQQQMEKRPRGRPRKYNPDNQTGQTSSNPVRLDQDQNQNQPQQVEKRQRGRPRLYNPDYQTGQTSSNPVRLDQDQNQNQPQQVEKRPRGRPRLYNPDYQTPTLHSSPFTGGGGNFSDPTANRKRGRPPVSPNKQPQIHPLGAKLTARTITVNPGENIYAKLMALSDQGPITISILSVNGAISTVNLRKDSEPSEFVTYEGKYDMVSLNGSFVNDGNNRSGSLNVVFSGNDNQIMGGSVVNSLIASTEVQIVVGSFVDGVLNPEPITIVQPASVSPKTRSSKSAGK